MVEVTKKHSDIQMQKYGHENMSHNDGDLGNINVWIIIGANRIDEVIQKRCV